MKKPTIPHILGLIDHAADRAGGGQCDLFVHLMEAIEILHDQQTADREQLEDLRSRFNKEAEAGTEDKVRLLTDTDGDGVFDQYTVATDIDPLTCDPVNGHLAGGMTAEDLSTHEQLHAGPLLQKLQHENTELVEEASAKVRVSSAFIKKLQHENTELVEEVSSLKAQLKDKSDAYDKLHYTTVLTLTKDLVVAKAQLDRVRDAVREDPS